jgi:hypothetical protein
MNYLADIDSIELRRYTPELHGKKIVITTPPMNVPFGLEKFYEKLQLKLVFHNHRTDTTMRQFFHQIIDLEKRLQTLAPTTSYHSNIKRSKGYDPLLVLRVQDDDSSLIKALSELTKESRVRCKFELQKQWSYNDRSGTTFNLLEVEMV